MFCPCFLDLVPSQLVLMVSEVLLSPGAELGKYVSERGWFYVGWRMGRPQSADQKFVRARGPQNWNPEVFDQTRCSRTFVCRICLE